MDVLIQCYENGIGVEQDVQQAQEWRQQKEERGALILPTEYVIPEIQPLEEDKKSDLQKVLEDLRNVLKNKR